ncbi:MAG: energy-coupling factor transporter transmembrane component T [Gemmatimonadales bacterium]|nr:energy-coupling factor transporter transmembrane component T [Gemmatimonadales bacterium]
MPPEKPPGAPADTPTGAPPPPLRELAFIPLAVALNVAMGVLASQLGLPVFLDTLGTLLGAALLGARVGMAAGLVSQLITALQVGAFMLAFAPLQLLIAACGALAARAGAFRRLPTALLAGALTGALAGAVSSRIAYTLFGGVTAPGVSMVTATLRALGLPLDLAVAAASISTDVLDKVVVFGLVAGVLAGGRADGRSGGRALLAAAGESVWDLGSARSPFLPPVGSSALPPAQRPPDRSSARPPAQRPPVRSSASSAGATALALTLAVLLLAYLLPPPWGPVGLAGVVAVALAGAGQARALGRATAFCILPWGFLVVIHVVLGAADGWTVALAQGARLYAILAASAALLATFDGNAFLEAAAARGWPYQLAYLVVAALQAIPRLAARAERILEAQRLRGLRVRGGPLVRARALLPLAVPLAVGALQEVDARAMALELRGLGVARRTAIAPPPDTARDRLLRWGALALVLAALAWRVRG